MRRGYFLCLLFCGCAASVSIEVEEDLTISQGLYGQAAESCDAEGCVPRQGAMMAFFDNDPSNGDQTPVIETTTASNGFWELPLESARQGWLAIGSTKTGAYYSAFQTSVPLGLSRIDWKASSSSQAGTWNKVK